MPCIIIHLVTSVHISYQVSVSRIEITVCVHAITYINQVTDVISQDSKLNMFADDMALYRVITSTNDYVNLQKDISKVSNFLNTKLLEFNLGKCKFMSVSKKTSRLLKAPTLLLNGYVLQSRFLTTSI